MKNTIIKYGFGSLITAFILFLLALTLGQNLDYDTQMVVGYAAMVSSLIFVFFGIKHFRNNENNGKLTIGKALLIGILISLFAAVGFAIVDYLYTSVINPNFVDEYLTSSLATLKENLPAEEYEVESKALIKQMEDYGSSGIMAMMMFVQVLVIGFVISLISSLILQRK